MGDTGLEPVPKTQGKTAKSGRGGAKSDALEDKAEEMATEQRLFIEILASLPTNSRRGLVQILQALSGRKK